MQGTAHEPGSATESALSLRAASEWCRVRLRRPPHRQGRTVPALGHRGPAVTHRDPTLIPSGHRIALTDLDVGATVHEYGQSIGVATAPISRGEQVHSHNIGMDLAARTHEFGTVHTELPAPTARRTFDGYRRADGRAGTRTYIAILTTVNCSGTTAKLIADKFRGGVLDGFENVDGVIALTHQSGCGLVLESEGAQVLLRTLNGYAGHPNIAGVLMLSLGCEMTPTSLVLAEGALPSDTVVESLSIQEAGGMRNTVAAGVEKILALAEQINNRHREPIDISELVLGLNCGGFDGYSGITANPALGWASDVLVAHGGTSVLAETPEIYGAEHLLTARATTPAVGHKLIDRIDWWETYIHANGGTMDNNPSPGNIAGGATVVVFTTGRGSVFGCKPTPSIVGQEEFVPWHIGAVT